jgi:hypothetical protein
MSTGTWYEVAAPVVIARPASTAVRHSPVPGPRVSVSIVAVSINNQTVPPPAPSPARCWREAALRITICRCQRPLARARSAVSCPVDQRKHGPARYRRTKGRPSARLVVQSWNNHQRQTAVVRVRQIGQDRRRLHTRHAHRSAAKPGSSDVAAAPLRPTPSRRSVIAHSPQRVVGGGAHGSKCRCRSFSFIAWTRPETHRWRSARCY